MRKFLVTSAFVLGIAAVFVDACSWNNPVWPKDPRSDTPLFRFVIGIGNNTKSGYIDASGRVVIPPIFDAQGGNYGYDDFFDGVALVETHREHCYINSKGVRLFGSRNSGPFSEGLAEFREGDKFGYLNTRGDVAIPPTFESADRFSEGLAAIQIDRKYGYIDPKGRFIVKPDLAKAFPFRNGFARVIKQSGCLYIGYGPCDSFNRVVLPSALSIDPPPRMSEPRCMYSFMDRTGRDLSAAAYREAKDFSEQLAPVGNGNVWGFVDAKGTIAIPMQYQNAESFSDGLAAVQIGGKWGYVNHSGTLVITPQFLAAFPFSEGLALTIVNGWQYQFIDMTGKRAIPGSFTGASSFVRGRAHVRYGIDYDTATWAYIDHRGRTIFRYNVQGPLVP